MRDKYFLTKCTMCNYADDNPLSYIQRQLVVLKSVVENESEIVLEWFDNNQSRQILEISSDSNRK